MLLQNTNSFLLIQDFLIDEKDFVEGPDWIGLNPILPIYI